MATNMSAKRLMKELGKVSKSLLLPGAHQKSHQKAVCPTQINNDGLPPGIELVQSGSAGSELSDWLFDIRVLDENPIYKDGVYRLKFRFSKSYPIEPPEVTFEKQADRPIPIHPHIYSNGIICLDLLGSQGWSPVQSAQSVCMSIQSMLTSNTKNERPPGDEEFVRGNTLRPRDIEFLYHDNTV
ncbi:unnamed protein product [Clonostachys rhizophaga]|uniref:UBC core domain-containing protein n=1 Tax=Clonostachys rhizophaga TaxID=160324 RepID=A0A9N9YRZ0_9HYPO|nr:unnamed protein product [Clonostachys rhizophaga]